MTHSLNFRVENLGPIRQGAIELRPLTLLIGKNNTGKTYFAHFVHAAHKALDEAFPNAPTPRLEVPEIPLLQEFLRKQREIRAVPSDGETIRHSPPIDAEMKNVLARSVLPPSIATKAQLWLEQFLQETSRGLPRRMQIYFGVSGLEELTFWGTQDSDSVCSAEVYSTDCSNHRHLFGTKLTPPDIERIEFSISDERLRRLESNLHLNDRDIGETTSEYRAFRYSSTLCHAVCSNYLRTIGLGTHSYYLPSGRSGLLQAWTDVVRMKLRLERERFGLESDSDISLGGVALDLLSEFQNLFSTHRRYPRRVPDRSPRALALAPTVELLNHTLRGSVAIESKLTEVPSLIYDQGGNHIPVQRASSMVADLAPLLIWVRELVSPGDLLIVDEPESHLHPEAIRLVARALVRLANAGVKVLCTTHSSVLLHQISNCMLSANVTSVDTSLSAEDRIAHSDIGVFRFRHEGDEGGVVVSPVEIEPDWGIPEEEYVDIADDLTNQTAALIDAQRT